MKGKLHALLKAAIKDCFDQGLLIKTTLPDYIIEIPNNPDHGHFATNIPMLLASSQKRPPREIASVIVEVLKAGNTFIEEMDVAGPGFINFRIQPAEWYSALSRVVTLKKGYGRSKMGAGQKVLVEFVSANPTGPLHIGHGRGAALGDTLCRILAFCGFDVVREFYINDAGQQIRLLGESVFSRLKQMSEPDYPFPENGYHGDYIPELARSISETIDLLNISEEETIRTCAHKGKEMMIKEIKDDLARFRVEFDAWYSEKDLYDSGVLQETLEMIKKNGRLYENEGALWIKTSDFGDDKDRVIRKSDSRFTYFASDIAYHLEKHRRGFEKVINIWGADHHGYVPRIKAALLANGIPENWLSVILIQLVKLWKGGEESKMSKRSGTFVTLHELVEEVGVDAARFVFLTKNHDSTLDFDIDLVKKQDSDNPVYYVQYAHARICSIFRKAQAIGLSSTDGSDQHLERLVLDEEMSLIRIMAGFSSLLEEICKVLEPHRLTYYLTSLAASFHKYFNLGMKNPAHRIINDDDELSRARLFLVEAVRCVLANGLELLGISAPKRM